MTSKPASLPEARPLAMLLRHAERQPIRRLEDTMEARLLPAGWEAARALGRDLAQAGPLSLRHSPVPRCAETAQGLAEGAIQAGGRARIEGPLELLGGPYMRDWGRAMARVFAEGAEAFVQSWFDGLLPEELAMPPRQATQQQAQVLVDSLGRAEPDELCLHVSHDWNVLCLRHFLADRGLEAGWPGYLEPVLAWLDEAGRLRLRSGDSEKAWSLPLDLG